jgi:hypothetical protein
MIEDLLNTPIGQILISVILGLGLATVFKKICKGQNCIVIQSPDIKEIEKYYYKVDDNCFKYTPYVTQCSENSQ